MKASELRIGNLVFNRDPQRNIIIEDISLNFVNGYRMELTEGIPLNEEWLIKLGFEETYSSEYTLRFSHAIEIEFDYKFNRAEKTKHVVWRGNHIKCDYVHQLQNLYHALTGTDLTLKE